MIEYVEFGCIFKVNCKSMVQNELRLFSIQRASIISEARSLGLCYGVVILVC